MKTTNKYFFALGCWLSGFSDKVIFYASIIISIAAGIISVQVIAHSFAQITSHFIRELLAMIFVSAIIMKLLKYAMLTLKCYFEVERLHGELCESHMELELAHAALLEASIRDNKSGAYNANILEEAAETIVRQAKRNNCHAVCVFIDIDLMKEINDTYGHLIGDDVLTTVAQKLMKIFRDTDMVVRFGGDEFVVLGYANNPTAMYQKLCNIEAFEMRFVDEGGFDRMIKINFSFGYSEFDVSDFPSSTMSAKDFATMVRTTLLKSADAEMYKAKAKKRLAR